MDKSVVSFPASNHHTGKDLVTLEQSYLLLIIKIGSNFRAKYTISYMQPCRDMELKISLHSFNYLLVDGLQLDLHIEIHT